MSTSTLISGQETVYSFKDINGNPRTEAWVVGEFLSSYVSGGVAFDFGKYFRRITEIQMSFISGAPFGVSGQISGQIPLVLPRRDTYDTPMSARIELAGTLVSGSAPQLPSSVASGASVSGIRFLARILGY